MAVIDCQAHHISYEEIESMYLVESESSPFSYRAYGELLARTLNPKVPFRSVIVRFAFGLFVFSPIVIHHLDGSREFIF